MQKRYRITALLLAALCLPLAGCSREPDFEKESELPYGATMREDKVSFAIPMTYDRRFIDDPQVTAVADFLASIQNADGDLYRSSTFDYYADYQVNEVYSYKTAQELVQALHDSVASYSGDDFTFNMVLINDFTTDRDTTNLSDAFGLLDGIAPESTPKPSETIEEAWDLTVEWDIAYNGGESYYVVEEQHVLLFKDGDKYLCMM